MEKWEKWEYRVDLVLRSFDPNSDEEEILNIRGEYGWELTSVISNGTYSKLYWKRKK